MSPLDSRNEATRNAPWPAAPQVSAGPVITGAGIARAAVVRVSALAGCRSGSRAGRGAGRGRIQAALELVADAVWVDAFPLESADDDAGCDADGLREGLDLREGGPTAGE